MKAICCLLIGFFLCSAWPQSAAADKVRIAVTNLNMSFLPTGVALQRGFFKDEKLDVEIIRMNVPNTVTAMMSGDG
jgi:ABC-type nitrate/sulfonate/bicarbonate transport system substrate-binding protein